MELQLTDNETSLAVIESEYALCVGNAHADCGDHYAYVIESDLDPWDLAVCTATAMVSAVVTTSEAFEKWLAGVHDAASGSASGCDNLQKLLGNMLHHKGDSMDMFSKRDGDDPWRLFHRLFFGHDILGKGDDIVDNPFYLMIGQMFDPDKPASSVLRGVLQAVRHLMADTFSKQGLPLPGSSYLDYDLEDGRRWNHLIDVVQNLSKEANGDKRQAEALYEHLFTIRAQDVAGGMLAKAVIAGYAKIRGIEDDVRMTQVRLLAYTMSFYAQAIVGAARQKGVPYVNTPLGYAAAKELATLLVKSNQRTVLLGKKTGELHVEVLDAVAQHDRLAALLRGEDLEMLMEGPNER